MRNPISRVLVGKRDKQTIIADHVTDNEPPAAPPRGRVHFMTQDPAERRRRINSLADEILLMRVLCGARPETQGGREKEARLSILLATAMVDEKARIEAEGEPN